MDRLIHKLPNQIDLPVSALAAAFQSTTNSYKYLWFLGILKLFQAQLAEREFTGVLSFEDIAREMIQIAWYPVAQCYLSLGVQDKIGSDIKNYIESRGDRHEDSTLQGFLKSALGRQMQPMRYVPYRFLAPWFRHDLKSVSDSQKNKKIMELSHRYFDQKQAQPLYKIEAELARIILQPDWMEYIAKFYTILFDFGCWNFCRYLQARNPSALNISEKIFPPARRDLANAKRFWGIVRDKTPLVSIYTRRPLEPANFSIDHFLPWSFVAHDQIWNTLPVENEVNSAKNNVLPDLDTYLKDFSEQHQKAILSIDQSPHRKLLEDYYLAFRVGHDELIEACKNPGSLQSMFENEIRPLHDIASNMGFACHWIYRAG